LEHGRRTPGSRISALASSEEQPEEPEVALAALDEQPSFTQHGGGLSDLEIGRELGAALASSDSELIPA